MNLWTTLAAVLLLSGSAALAQVSSSTTTLAVAGHTGEAPIIRSHGHAWVEVEALARLTNSTLGFEGSKIILSLPASSVPLPQPQPTAPTPEKTGFSRDFLRAGIEQMSVIREWRSAIENAIRTNNPVDESWVSGYRRAAEDKMAIATSMASTDSDHKALPLLQNALEMMRQLSGRFLEMRRTVSYVSPNSLDNDPLDQKILACAQAMASVASGGQFQDIPACH